MKGELLRRAPIFAELAAEDLDRLARLAEPVAVATGQLLMTEGEPGDALYVVVGGTFEVTKRSGESTVLIGTTGPGEILGEMALLEGGPRTASVRAVSDASLLRISRAAFEELIGSRPSAAISIVQTVTNRLRNTEAMLQQREKLAALGTLSAGLAHELNNPAAAVRRSAAQLREVLADWERATADVGALSLDDDQGGAVGALRSGLQSRVATPQTLDPLALSDLESAIQELLEEHDLEDAWELAPPLAALGWEVDTLRSTAARFPDGSFRAVARWLALGSTVASLLNEVGAGAERISEIVKAVKTYSFLDQAPVQEVDVHEGLENTLVILRHKLKTGVRVVRDYAPDLPRIEAYGSELNQVWTNIIDNAIDAMDGEGELRLRTARQEGGVLVDLCDSGPGIPPDVQKHIFEPFFTTKEPGVGTGLGLQIAYNIVQKHHGRIQVRSKPGQTCFEVTLPLALERR